MKRLSLILVLTLSFLFLDKAILPVYSATDYQALSVPTKVTKGTITNISRIDSQVTVSFTNPAGKKEEATFLITDNTKFVKDGVRMSNHSNLSAGDEIVVEYFDDPTVTGTQAADRIELVTHDIPGSKY